jgi:hypothetical protein
MPKITLEEAGLPSPQKALAEAELALINAEAVRRAAIQAVDLARAAVKLEAEGVAAELLLEAATVAASAVKEAQLAALEAWEAAAIRVSKNPLKKFW